MSDFSAEYIRCVEPNHRQQFGQFFTPVQVATFMCKWVLAGKPKGVYDPAFGLGAFYFAARELNPCIIFSSNDVDVKIINFFNSRAGQNSQLLLTHQDYLLSWGQRHQGIVCNPPYMRFQKFINRSDVFRAFQTHVGCNLSGYTNIASAFLLKSIYELEPNGRLAYIMPLEFLNTGYGKIVKQQLIENGFLKAIIKLEHEKEVFPEATTTTGILLLAKDGKKDPVNFYIVSELTGLESILEQEPIRSVPLKELNPVDKWLKYFDSVELQIDSSNLVAISYYGGFSRGIATGANEFFVFSASKAREIGIPRSLLSPCITKSAQIKTRIFTNEDFQELVESDANVFVLNINGKMPPLVEQYIQYGEEKGHHQRYLTMVRNPWYKLERRVPAPLLFGVFSRDGFKVVRNRSDAINLTCYHGFYPNLFGQQFVDRLFLYFQSRVARTILGLSMRQYGDSLDKFEPNDLNEAFAPSPNYLAAIPLEMINESMERCTKGLPLAVKLEQLFESLIENTHQRVTSNDLCSVTTHSST